MIVSSSRALRHWPYPPKQWIIPKFATHNLFKLLSELSRNSPVCGQLQVAGNEEVLTIMEAIASGVDITQPPHREQLKLLQQKVLPVLSSFILKCYCGRNHLYDVCCLVLRLRDLIVAPFVCCEPAFPPPCQSNSLSFFPKLPQVQAGKGDVPSWPP